MNSVQGSTKLTESWSDPLNEYHFELQEEESCLVAVFGGEITTSNYSEFRNDYNEICRRLSLLDHKRLVVDLTQTTFFSSLFAGMMVKLSLTTRNQDGALALCGLSEQLNDLMKKLLLLERVGTNGALKHFATREEAINGV